MFNSLNLNKQPIFFLVCGVQAVCTSALHRPVCSCPDGFEGNAYDKCTKVRLISSSVMILKYK
jgi:hypothetical protein